MSVSAGKVYCVHTTPKRSPLALGMVIGYARQTLADTWDLNARFASTREEISQQVDPGTPSVFLFSNYMWNVEQNLELSSWVKERYPGCTTIHGGPSTPSYLDACHEFLKANASVDYAVHGEGERTGAELLAYLAGERAPEGLWKEREQIHGLSFLDGERFVRTPARERSRELDSYPSPYLTGIFDDCPIEGWESATIETNRGCPYGCTFCDWGSATLQKLRCFDLERVEAEVNWLTSRAIPELWIADANFGILPRDVAITRVICEAKKRTGRPGRIVVNYAKNTHAHLVEIVEMLVDAGLVATGFISLQTRDASTLEVVRRKNIKPREYDKLTEVFRRKGLPLSTQLMVALPGSTLESFKGDLRAQFHEDVDVQIFYTAVLPNSPMADPVYVREQELECDEEDFVAASKTFSRETGARMEALARLFRCAHTYGMFRHLLCHLEWDHGIDPIDFLDGLVSEAIGGASFPRLSALHDTEAPRRDILNTHRLFREQLRSENDWAAFYQELGRYIAARFPTAVSSGLEAILRLQTALMPGRGRRLPERVELPHDVVQYVTDRVAGGQRALAEYPAGGLEIKDPWELCEHLVQSAPGQPPTAWELVSVLSRGWQVPSALTAEAA